MATRADTLVIVPAYNESESILHVIKDLRENAPDADIVVINDGSHDNTSILARNAGVHVVDLPVNLGIGGAVQTGYLFALENGHKYAMQFDADGQHKGSEIPALLQRIKQGDVDAVIGSRFTVEDKNAFRSTFARRIGIFFFSRLIRIITGWRFTDPTSGFTVINRKAMDVFSKRFPEDHPPPETIVLLKKAGCIAAEVPAAMKERMNSSSSITLSGSVYFMIKVTLAILVDLLRKI
jgi:glycosyltransferase involved in cell wall biosynthesis